MSIDNLIVGQSKQIEGLTEYPPDYDPTIQVLQQELPLKHRLRSKVWKMRLQAYEELLSNMSEADDDIVLSMIKDSNTVCQEKGLMVVLAYVAQARDASFQKEVIKEIVERCLSMPKLRQKGTNIMVQLFENNAQKLLFEVILTSMDHKNPKIVQGCIALILELLQQFGLRQMDNLKPFFPKMAKLCEAQQSQIKQDAIQFYKEVAKWFGKAIDAFTGPLSEKLREEIKKIGESQETLMQPIRGEETRVVQDAYELVEAVDALHKFGENYCSKVLELPNWKEQREQLELLHRAISVPKILMNQNVSSIMQMFKKLLNQQNLNISMFCVEMIGLLSTGLRRQFSQSARIVLSQVLGKLRDTKQMVVDKTIATIKKLFLSLGFDDFFEDLRILLDDKAQGTKVNVFSVYEFLIDETPKEKLAKSPNIKTLINTSKKFTEDGNPEVRTKSLFLIAKISSKLFGGNMAIDLPEDKKRKLQDMMSKLYCEPANTTPPVSLNSKIPPSQLQKENYIDSANIRQEPSKLKLEFKAELQALKSKTEPAQRKSSPVAKSPAIRKVEKSPPVKQSILIQVTVPKKSSKDERLLEQFTLSSYNEAEFERLKGQIRENVPQLLFDKMFSYNQQMNIQAMQHIKVKISNPVQCSDLILRWAYFISFMRDSVMLQTESATFIYCLLHEFRQGNYQLQPKEVLIVLYYVKMICNLYCKCTNPKLPARTVSMLLNILSEVPVVTIGQIEEQEPGAERIYDMLVKYSSEWVNCQFAQQSIIKNQVLQNINKEQPISEISDVDSVQIRMDNLNQLQAMNARSQIIQSAIIKEETPEIRVFCDECQKVLDRRPYDRDLILNLAHQYVSQKNQMETIFSGICSVASMQEFVQSIPYPKLVDLVTALIQTMVDEIGKNSKINIILSTTMMRIIENAQNHEVYLFLFDILIKQRQSANYQTGSYVAIITRILNRFIKFIKEYTDAQLREIMSRFEYYLAHFKSDQAGSYDLYMTQAIVHTVKVIVTHNTAARVVPYVTGMLKDIVSQSEICHIILSLKEDFANNVDSFVQVVCRSHINNWRAQVLFLRPDQLLLIEQKITQQKFQMSKLEKTLTDLEHFQQTLNQ